MPKIPSTPEEIFEEFTEDFQKVYKDQLLSIVLYGSGARGEYLPKKSDINFLIVLRDTTIPTLRLGAKLLEKWRKRNVTLPLFLTKEYIASSLDTFPIEFLDMKSGYRVIWGEDVLGTLSISPFYMRLQCEREVKAKFLALTQGYLRGTGEKGLEHLVDASLRAFTAILRGLLFITGVDIPQDRAGILSQAAARFNLDEQLFLKLLSWRKGEKKTSKEEIHTLLDGYVQQIAKLMDEIDKLEVPREGGEDDHR